MQETESPNKYFRLLNPDEIVREGDEFLHRNLHEWRPATFIGIAAGSEPYASKIYRRPVQVDEWIDYAKQKPTGADFPISTFNGRKVGFATESYSSDDPLPCNTTAAKWSYNDDRAITHWRRITPPRPLVKRVKVREESGSEREVIPQADGSLKVGCVTIPAKDFDEIVRQRAEAIAKCQS